jgi:hypothetical protein
MAGYADGEGCIRWSGSGRPGCGTPYLGMTNTDRAILDTYQRTFGGHVGLNTRARPGYRTVFQWQVHGSSALAAITSLLPYLREKAPQARIVLALPGIRPHARLSLIAELKRLKHVDQGTDS